MRCSLRKVVFCIFLLSLAHLLYYVVHKIIHHPPEQKNEIVIQIRKPVPDEAFVKSHRLVEIWGKAAIGTFLWEHIFEGSPSKKSQSLIEEDSLFIDSLHLKFSTGYDVQPQTVDYKAKNVIVVLNGREPEKVRVSMMWLDELLSGKRFTDLRNLGLVLLGNEQCNNSWLQHYFMHYKSILKFAFVVYDSPDVDDRRIFQWPLGVATYRNFPVIPKIFLNIEAPRPHRCNFLGTVYAGSSREILYDLIQLHFKDVCFVKVRQTWEALESKESMDLYQKVIRESDLTLCPVGKNSEAYRIYEAMSYGSVPVIEDVMTPGYCGSAVSQGHSSASPFRLLKMYKAPVIYIKNWSELTGILEREKVMSQREIIQRRLDVLEWYQKFKYVMRNKLVAVIKEKFVW